MKIFRKIILAIIGIWVLLSGAWFVWGRVTYSRYTDGMRQNAFSTPIVPRYYSADDTYTYFVKYPDYPMFIGNLAVSANDDAANVQAFLIWIPFIREKEYGLIIVDGSESHQIYTDVNGHPTDEQYTAVTDKYAEEIEKMVQSAKKMWNIE